ncbi:putative ATP synthase subunit epsilon [Candidatus Fokinia solitaria]|uniref:Putative ATP synthase subunit epsilon n=1 Tax=Candidatus Fokinia solitaria TaxID=1802984 RepID=A0A2U8BRL9_9RICK|nr:hypothetical protein [Candidatus Fokinia solitaria]AWD32985.1 putative ATP synthase subunit epsilon [Candidatus Fokinia solitaria]
MRIYISSPHGKIAECTASKVSFASLNGAMEIMDNHENFIAPLVNTNLTVARTDTSDVIAFDVTSGAIKMDNGECLILLELYKTSDSNY